jgi:hypothetical protein
MKELDFEGVPDHIAADRAWEDYRQRNDSIIVDLFQVRDEKGKQIHSGRHLLFSTAARWWMISASRSASCSLSLLHC